MGHPCVSIIVTTYNVEDYLESSLQGVISQSLKDIEIIIVDDGSTDKTQTIIKSYAEKDQRIKTFFIEKNTPGGVGRGANIGLRAAVGEYIGFVDGDDIYDRTMFEKLYFKAKQCNAELAMCHYNEFQSDSFFIHDVYTEEKYIFNNLETLENKHPKSKKKILNTSPAPWRKIYKRDFLENNAILFPECDYFYEDNFFHWLCILNADRIARVDETLYYHRMNRIGQTEMAGGTQLLGVFYQHQLLYAHLEEAKILENYKDELVHWLIKHIIWVKNKLSRTYAEEFYSELLHVFKFYTDYDIQIGLLNYRLASNDMILINSVLNKNEKIFMSCFNRQNEIITPKKRFLSPFLNQIKMKLKKIEKKIKPYLGTRRKDMERVERKLENLHNEVHLGFYLSEKKIKEMMKIRENITYSVKENETLNKES